jgi:two-component system, chemotaxis family, protein-glutamate methylesterase/glutaminase
VTPGRVLVAPPDRHLLVKKGRVSVVHGPRENGFRPAVDPLFRTAARSYGPRVVGIILSGGLNDGTHGMALIHEHGGLTIVQDPEEALIASMPLSAIREVDIDHVVPVGSMPALLLSLVNEPAGGSIMSEETEDDEDDEDVAEKPRLGVHPHGDGGPISPYTCPECGGALWESNDNRLTRFRCHVGHGFTAETLVEMQGSEMETALWTALRILEQNASLSRRMAEKSSRGRLVGLADFYHDRAVRAEAQAEQIRRLLMRAEQPVPPDEEPLSKYSGGSVTPGDRGPV